MQKLLIALVILWSASLNCVSAHAQSTPTEFVPVCERSRLVRATLERIFFTECYKIGKDKVSGLSSLPVSGVDVSGLRQLQCGDFSGMRTLRFLDLSGLQGPVPECLFDELENLEQLGITKSPRLSTLPERVFTSLRKLRVLRISGTGITSLPDQIFLNLGRLTDLDLGFNQLKVLGNVQFAQLSSLRRLDIGNNKLTDVPLVLFDDLSLAHIWFGLNPLQPASRAMYETVTPVCGRSERLVRTLETHFHKSCNAVTSQDLLAVVELTVDFIFLDFASALKCTDFSGLRNLRKLRLVRVKGPLAPCLFADTQDLISLAIVESDLAGIHPDIFSNLKQLRRLHIVDSMNFPAVFSPDLLAPLTELRYLNLSANRISDLHERQFNKLKNLRNLHLVGNRIHSLSDQTFSNQLNLRVLDLSDNGIEALQTGLIAKLSNLENLSIASNRFEAIPDNFFSNSLNLRTIDIGSRFLRRVPDLAFVGLPRLETVDVIGATLSATSKAAFQGVPKVFGLPSHFPNDGSSEEWRRE